MAAPIRTSIIPIMLAIKAKLGSWTAQVPLGDPNPMSFAVPQDRIRTVVRNRWPEPTQAPNDLTIYSAPQSVDDNIVQGAGRQDFRTTRPMQILARTRLSLDPYSDDSI